MIETSARPARSLKQAISRRLPKRRDDSGLTTLEWLLIVAAVAGLAALAVVLVQNVVSETSEQIAGSSARETAARIAGLAVQDDAKLYDSSKDRFDTWNAWESYHTSKCNRISVTYADAGVTAAPTFKKPLSKTDQTDIPLVTTAGTGSPATATPQASCAIN